LADIVATLRDDVIDVLVQTDAWKRLFPGCLAVPSQPCSFCGGRRGSWTLSGGDRSRAKSCLLGAGAGQISGLKAALNAGTLVLFTRDGSGKLVRHTL